jgi:hypothetical protein
MHRVFAKIDYDPSKYRRHEKPWLAVGKKVETKYKFGTVAHVAEHGEKLVIGTLQEVIPKTLYKIVPGADDPPIPDGNSSMFLPNPYRYRVIDASSAVSAPASPSTPERIPDGYPLREGAEHGGEQYAQAMPPEALNYELSEFSLGPPAKTIKKTKKTRKTKWHKKSKYVGPVLPAIKAAAPAGYKHPEGYDGKLNEAAAVRDAARTGEAMHEYPENEWFGRGRKSTSHRTSKRLRRRTARASANSRGRRARKL